MLNVCLYSFSLLLLAVICSLLCSESSVVYPTAGEPMELLDVNRSAWQQIFTESTRITVAMTKALFFVHSIQITIIMNYALSNILQLHCHNSAYNPISYYVYTMLKRQVIKIMFGTMLILHWQV